MTTPWTGSGPLSGQGVASGPVTLIEGSTFCISEPGGDILPGGTLGLFVRDTRVLARWQLTVDGLEPQPLAVQRREPFAAAFLGRLPPRAGRADSTLLVIRRRYVGDGMREELTIRNTAASPTSCLLSVTADSDFADLFEVKEGRGRPLAGAAAGAPAKDGGGSGGVLVIASDTARGAGLRQELLVRGDDGAVAAGGALQWRLDIPGHGERTVSVEAVPVADGAAMALRHPAGQAEQDAVPANRLSEWRRRGPQVRTADASLAAVLRQSVEDLGALRIYDPERPGLPVVAAGAPWFMALFGRDSLLTSWMLLPWDTDLAVGTLATLAARQGAAVNLASEEEPGRILHEVRFGPAATAVLGGASAYYGTADATPLFVVVLGELARWGHDDETVRALLPHADRALDWIEHYGDADGDGFVEYSRKTSRGLANQGWKDSFDGINFADGRVATPPIALAEVQGYTFAAYRARARLARMAGDQKAERRWQAKAAALKRAFNEAFWLPDSGWFAVGLDADKRPVDALTSNIGHCLWTGIADRDKAEAVAAHLLSADMFSGWGIRTLAASMGAYNPMSYHNGSVWPHDNALCAAGLMRYGFVEGAQRVAEAVLDAAAQFGYRLPELFCGFDRGDFPAPVPYPASCSPQAWAAAAPLQLLYTLLRVAPDQATRRVWCSPVVPARYLPLRASGIRLGRSRLAISVTGGGWTMTGIEGSGLDLVRAPRPARSL